MEHYASGSSREDQYQVCDRQLLTHDVSELNSQMMIAMTRVMPKAKLILAFALILGSRYNFFDLVTRR